VGEGRNMDFLLTGPSLGEDARVRLEETEAHARTRLGELAD